MALSLSWGIDDTVVVNNRTYTLDLEYSKVLRWYEMWRDETLSEEYRVFLSLVMILDVEWGNTPTNYTELIQYVHEDDLIELSGLIIKRIAGDITPSASVKRDLKGNIIEDEEKEFYDIEEDSGYIYASFLMDYQIDLIEARENKTLHWDKFNHLLSGLSENTRFKKVIEIRAMEITSDMTYEQKEAIQKAKAAVALKTTRAEIEFSMMDLKQKREYMKQQEEKQNS